MREKIRIGIKISGGGTNMQAIVKACEEGRVNGEVVFVGSDRPDAKGLAWAKEKGIRTFVVDYEEIRKSCRSREYHLLPAETIVNRVHEKSRFIHEWFGGDRNRQLEHVRWKIAAEQSAIIKMGNGIDLLVLAGFMRVSTSFLIDYMNSQQEIPRIMNIHPALLPAFPGVDGYGDTLRYGCKVGGCTVHFVDYGEDTGPIIDQRAIPVLPTDTIDSFRKRGLEQEYQLYPECIQLFAEGRLAIQEIDGRRTVLIR